MFESARAGLSAVGDSYKASEPVPLLHGGTGRGTQPHVNPEKPGSYQVKVILDEAGSRALVVAKEIVDEAQASRIPKLPATVR